VRARAFPLAAELVKQGHEVTIFLTPYDNLEYSGKEWIAEGVRVRNLSLRDTSKRSLAAVVPRLCQAVRDYVPDLVHVFKPKGFAGIAAMLLRRSHRVILDCDDWEGWGGWNEALSYSWIVKEYIDLQEKWLIRGTPVITAASRVLIERARELRKEDSPVFYVPNCLTRERVQLDLNITQISPEDEKKALGLSMIPLIFYAGHFDPADDTGFFCRGVSPALIRGDAALAIVGEGAGLETVKNFFSRLNVRVHFFGRVSFAQYARVLNASDVATFPFPDNAVYRAKCSVRILDFMSFGKAVLTTALGQNLEYLVHGESGFLIPPGDEMAYQRALDLLLANGDLRARLGRTARQRVLSNFLWSGSSLESCLTAYDTALGSAGIFATQ
jgi:glycosyltransferase involved in cell wall biosynthesis